MANWVRNIISFEGTDKEVVDATKHLINEFKDEYLTTIVDVDVNTDSELWRSNIVVDTGWATPEEDIAVLSDIFPGVMIDVEFADELIPDNSGCYAYHEGVAVVENNEPYNYERARRHYIHCFGGDEAAYDEEFGPGSDYATQNQKIVVTPVSVTEQEFLTKPNHASAPLMILAGTLIIVGVSTVYEDVIKPGWKWLKLKMAERKVKKAMERLRRETDDGTSI